VIEAVDPIQIAPISMSSIYKVFDNLHLLWMCIWMCPYHIIAALVDQTLGNGLVFWVTLRQQLMMKCSD
jgi:hypothetical protein